MGGTPSNYQYSETALNFEKQIKPTSVAVETKITESPYKKNFLDSAQNRNIHDLNDFKDFQASHHSSKAPLVVLPTAPSRRLFFQTLRTQKIIPEDTLFIESHSQFLEWYQSYCIKAGQRYLIDGPLKQVLQQKGPRHIVIDWTSLKDTTGYYKSLIDKLRRIKS